MTAPTTELLQQQLSQALSRINKLEAQVEKMRKNTNTALHGQTIILARLVDHNDCPPPPGTEFVFVRNYDVGL